MRALGVRFGILAFWALALVSLAVRPSAGQSVSGVELSPFVIGLQPVVSNGAVGGILIDAEGVVARSDLAADGRLAAAWRQSLSEIDSELAESTKLRKISLRALEKALARSEKLSEPIPLEIRFLGGLQNIRYVFAYPERGDIVLAGYAEGWKVTESGAIVGVSTGRPVLMLEDLLVALQTAISAGEAGGLACSIDPTEEGLKRLSDYMTKIGSRPASAGIIKELTRRLGPQTITIRGAPEESHFARVMLAADVRMKRLAMGFEKSPVKGLPSFLSLTSGARVGLQKLMPRWWLAADFEPLLTDSDRLAWELNGKVQVRTEDDFLADDGARVHTGADSPPARKWADKMNERYDELTLRAPIFGELRNLMDLAVVAALIARERLPARVGHDFALLYDAQRAMSPTHQAPRLIPSQACLADKGKNVVVCISGGVAIDSWGIVERVEESPEIESVRQESAASEESATRWWWN